MRIDSKYLKAWEADHCCSFLNIQNGENSVEAVDEDLAVLGK